MLGQRVGNYQVVRRLGEGGMGTVYLAVHPELGRHAAVKVLHPDLARSDEMLQRFFNEARAANSVGHRGIVEVSDLGILPSGAPYIVMEFLDGESLAERMRNAGRLPLATAVEIAVQASSVIGAAHAKGVVHRDLKPDNLFLVPDVLRPGHQLLKVLDFGIAKLAIGPSSAGGELRTRTGAVLGTPRYMSPEQCRDSREVDHRTDIYSLGVVLYEMLSGTPPFESSSWGELVHLHIGVSPPELRARAPDVPEKLSEIVHRALEKDPGARFQSMAELEQALLEAVGGVRTLVMPDGPVIATAKATAIATAIATEMAPGAATVAVPPASGSGSTRRLEEPAAAHGGRRTTLAGAAAEVQREPATSKRGKRGGSVVPARAVGAAIAAIAVIAVIVIVGVIAARRAPAPAPLVVAPAAAPPKRASAPSESAPHPERLPVPRGEGHGAGDNGAENGDDDGDDVGALPASQAVGDGDGVNALPASPAAGNGAGMAGERERRGRGPAHRQHAPTKSSAPPPAPPPSTPHAREPLKI